jgi:hypothetical protein
MNILNFIDYTLVLSKYGCCANNNKILPKPKPETEFVCGFWWRGYPFEQFWGNCHALLGDIANNDGYQQLCHHYYLQNGGLSAKQAVNRIRKFLNING